MSFPYGMASRPPALGGAGTGNYVIPPNSRAGTVLLVWLDVAWNHLQPTHLGAIAGSNKIDEALAAIDVYNTGKPSGQHLKLGIRTYAGKFTPTGTKTAVGSFAWTFSSNIGSDSGTSPRWWTTGYRAAWDDFITKLGVLYDADPRVAVVCVGACTPGNYPEPFVKYAASAAFRQPMFDAGFDWQTDLDSIKVTIDQTAAAFPSCYVALNFNPNQKVTARDTWTNDNASSNAVMDYARNGGFLSDGFTAGGGWGSRFVLMNSSARDNPNFAGPDGAQMVNKTALYWPMYDHMKALGGPIAIQEAISGVVNGQPGESVLTAAETVANWCYTYLDARSIELQHDWVSDAVTYPQSFYGPLAAAMIAGSSSPPTPPPATSLKDPMRGMVQRGGTTIPRSQYAVSSVFDGFTISVNWADLQTADVNALDSSEVARINNAIAWCDARGMHLKIRLFCGTNSPAWLKTLVGTFLYQDPTDLTGVHTCAKFWTATYQSKYARLIQLIADEWDANDTVRDVTVSGSMTYYAEPLIIGISAPENQAEMVGGGIGWSGNFIPTPGAGYTSALAIAAHQSSINAHAVMAKTNASFSFNPMQILVGYKSASNLPSDDATISHTINLMDYFRGTLGCQAVLENNSVRDSFFTYNSGGDVTGVSGGKYGLMYTHMKLLSGPLFFQTATRHPNNRIGDFTKVMKGCIWLGANAVEPPTDYYADWQSTDADHTEYSPTQFAHWTALLRNSAWCDVTPPPVPDPGTDPGSGGGSGGSGGSGSGSGDGGNVGGGTGVAPAITWPPSIAPTVWVMHLYDIQGNFLTDLTEAYNRTMHFELNGVDACTFSVPLSWLPSGVIESLKTSVKVWRKVQDTVNGVIYEDQAQFPSFAGVVAGVAEDAAADEMQVTVYGAFWKLQHRYHLDRHAFMKDDSTILPFTDRYVGDPSAIMWQLIKFTNNVLLYSTGDKTGIIGPGQSDPDWDIYGYWATYDPPLRFTKKTPRGQNTWTFIQEVVAEKGWPDLVPLYTHIDGSRRLQYFNTAVVRGVRPANATTKFEFRTGLNNIDGIRRTTIVDPGSVATLVAVQGQGDTDIAKVVYPKTFDTDNYLKIDELGLYMAWTKLDHVHSRTDLRNYAKAQMERMNGPIKAYEIALNPVFPPYYKANFDMGDVILVSCDHGSMVFADVEQRVYQVDLAMSDNNIETCSVTMARDFTSAVPV